MLEKYLSDSELSISQEAINSQGKSSLYNGLVEHISKMKDVGYKGERKLKEDLKKLNGIIEKATNIPVSVGMDANPYPNAYVYIPDIDKNNPVINEASRFYFDNGDAKKLIKKYGTVLNGSVDRKTSKVEGIFKKLRITIFFTKGLMYGGYNITGEEAAAIIIHEIGHIFTYYEFLGSYVTTNYVLQHASRELLNTREIKRKYEILEETEELLNIELGDKESLTKTGSSTVIQTVILHSAKMKRESELNSDTYDLTAYEMLSDQFASRHGAGRALATGLAKMYKGHEVFMNEDEFFVHQLQVALGLSIFGVITLGVVPLVLLFLMDPTKQIYDKPEDRVKRVKRDMVAQLKESSTTKERKQQLVKEIEDVDVILKNMKDKTNFIEWFWLKTRKSTRDNYNQKVFQQELEEMVSSDLYVLSEKFKSV